MQHTATRPTANRHAGRATTTRSLLVAMIGGRRPRIERTPRVRQYLLATLTNEERAYAASLREDADLTPEQFVRSVFTELDDPLLDADDVAELWGDGAPRDALVAALFSLEEQGFLESSTKTQRPFDEQGTKLYRSSARGASTITVTAVESQDAAQTSRYQFALDGRLIRGVARIDRLDSLAGTGNQRQEIKAHVNKIRDGVNSGTHVPNPVLLVMLEDSTELLAVGEQPSDDTPVSFVVIRPLEDFRDVTSPSGALIQRARIVEMSFPWRRAAFDEEKSILLVDGQQRTAAISLVSVDDHPYIDLGVSAVRASEEDAKRVFQVANDSVKISTDFSRALLASMSDAPGYLKDEQVTAEAVRILGQIDSASPFFGLVKFPGAARSATAVIAYNSLFGIVTHFRTQLPADLTVDAQTLANLVSRAFGAVKKTWPDAWGQRTTVSKLMHGAGIRAISHVLVDKITTYLGNGEDLDRDETLEKLEASLARLATKVVWTDAAAAEGTSTQKSYWRIPISGSQNTSQDIQTLSAFLTRESTTLDMNAARSKAARAR